MPASILLENLCLPWELEEGSQPHLLILIARCGPESVQTILIRLDGMAYCHGWDCEGTHTEPLKPQRRLHICARNPKDPKVFWVPEVLG